MHIIRWSVSQYELWYIGWHYGHYQFKDKRNMKRIIHHYHMWPSATKWGSLRGVSKLRNVFYCNKHYFLHILMQKLLLCAILLSKVTKCWTLPCIISFKTILQRYGLSKIVIYVYFYGPIKKQMFHNTSFLSYFHWKKCLWLLCLVWWTFRKNI